jgi:chromosome segregation ATPase
MWLFDLLFKNSINNRLTRLENKMTETADRINVLNTRVEKITGEVQALIDQLANVELPPDAQQALANLEASIANLDDKNPDLAA